MREKLPISGRSLFVISQMFSRRRVFHSQRGYFCAAATLLQPRRCIFNSSKWQMARSAENSASSNRPQGFVGALIQHWQRGAVIGIGVCMGIGTFLYFMWAPVQSDTEYHTSKITKNVLDDATIKEKAVLVTKEVVDNVLRDDASVTLLVDVITRLLQQENSKRATALFIKSILEDRYTQEVTKKFVLDVVEDEWVKEQVLDLTRLLVVDLLNDKSTRQVMTQFLLDTSTDALRDDKLQASSAGALRGTIAHFVIPWNIWGAAKPTDHANDLEKKKEPVGPIQSVPTKTEATARSDAQSLIAEEKLKQDATFSK